MLAITVWWCVSARKWFKGPKVNIEHQMLGREDKVLEGKEAENDSGDSSSGSIRKEEFKVLDDQKAGQLA